MKYVVATTIDNQTYTANLSIRSDAELRTVYTKCIEAICSVLRKAEVVTGTIKYSIDMPNIWRNGGFASIWLSAPKFADIYIDRDGKRFV